MIVDVFLLSLILFLVLILNLYVVFFFEIIRVKSEYLFLGVYFN